MGEVAAMSEPSNHEHNGNWLLSRAGVAAMGALAVIGLLIYAGHSAHLLGWLPYLLILACPLMHVFMHGGHGGGISHKDKPQDDGKPGRGRR